MAKFKLVFFSSLLVALGSVFVFREKLFNYFEPRLADIEKLAINAAIKEIKKDFQAPPPLRLSESEARPLRVPTKTGAPAVPTTKPAGQTSTVGTPLTISGTIKWSNIQRKNNGSLPPLAENSQLDNVARLRLEDMFAKQYFAHIAPDGSGAESVAKNIGYDYIALGENLALGNFLNDQDLVQAWMNSPGHRANILNTKYQEIGVAVKKGIFEGKSTWLGVQIFGKPASSCPQVDQGLKVKIDASESQLQNMQNNLVAQKADIDNTEPKGGREYNAKIEQYNTLVGQYNDFLAQTKTMIAEYNGEVSAFNQCLAR